MGLGGRKSPLTIVNPIGLAKKKKNLRRTYEFTSPVYGGNVAKVC